MGIFAGQGCVTYEGRKQAMGRDLVNWVRNEWDAHGGIGAVTPGPAVRDEVDRWHRATNRVQREVLR